MPHPERGQRAEKNKSMHDELSMNYDKAQKGRRKRKKANQKKDASGGRSGGAAIGAATA